MISVPSHSPHMLTSARIGGLPSHMHSVRKGLCRNDDLGGYDMLGLPAHVLRHEKGEAVTPAAYLLDAPKARHENVRYAEHFHQFLPFAHIGDLHSRPREDRLVGTHAAGGASETIRPYAIVSTRGFQFVSEAVA